MGIAFAKLMTGDRTTGRVTLHWHPNHEPFAEFQLVKDPPVGNMISIGFVVGRVGCDDHIAPLPFPEAWSHNATIKIIELLEGTIEIDGGALGARPVNVEEIPAGSDHYHLNEKEGGLLLGTVQFLIEGLKQTAVENPGLGKG